MIRTETIEIRGRTFVRTWSDADMKIERDGELYDEAVDPVDSGREYVETDIPIPAEEAEEADYLAALDRLGVSADE